MTSLANAIRAARREWQARRVALVEAIAALVAPEDPRVDQPPVEGESLSLVITLKRPLTAQEQDRLFELQCERLDSQQWRLPTLLNPRNPK